MKTFIVQIATSRRIVSWPLRRLDVSETALTARAWPSWYMRARTVAKHSVRVINVRQSLGGMVLTVDDEVGSFSNLRFLVQLKSYYKLRSQLDENGYPAVGNEPHRTIIAIRRRRERRSAR